MNSAWTGKTFKGVLVAVLAALMLLSVCFAMPRHASAESLYIRKIVSVVYDDSTSMRGDKWAYANYAMQAFCGMLNSEDQLYITYMSGVRGNAYYRPEQVDLSAGGIQGAVDGIRDHSDSSSTPFQAVEVAFDQLKSVNDSNINTQYWLVVITDGVFNEYASMSSAQTRDHLNDRFGDYADQVMPNGTRPQITFLGIGNIVAPDEDQASGIYTYSAQSAEDIIGAMNSMADRISGRTRLDGEYIRQISDRTIQVSSSIPLLNIVLFTQSTEAKVVRAEQENGEEIPVSRSVSLLYSGYTALRGGAFLLGDSQRTIESGTYEISFDQAVELDDLVVLFEPALELRMTIWLNGRELSGQEELKDAMEGDRISVSAAIYEMGTDIRVDPSLLPSDTEYAVTVTENGAVTEQIAGQSLSLSDYELHRSDTEITASVSIQGFNPIRYSIRFTPLEEPEHIYTVVASMGSEDSDIQIDEIGNNQDVQILFSVYDKGVPVTDPAAVQGLQPVITASPEGNGGTIAYSETGTIIFTPNVAAAPDGAGESYRVQVTCTIGDASASASYVVWLVKYEIFAFDAEETVRKTQFYGNRTGVSFYITRDGVRLDKAATLNGLEIAINEEHSDLLVQTDVAEDGTITVTPYAENGHEVTFGSWWGNWLYYWGLSGSDVVVTLTYPYGTATATIDVTGETALYQLLYVFLPLLIELGIAVFLILWVWFVVDKPRFPKGAVLYYGDIRGDAKSGKQYIDSFNEVHLGQFNRFFKNGIWKFKRRADCVNVGGIILRPDWGGNVLCERPLPLYQCSIRLWRARRDETGLKMLETKMLEGSASSVQIERLTVEDALKRNTRVLEEFNDEGFVAQTEVNSFKGKTMITEGIVLFYRNQK